MHQNCNFCQSWFCKKHKIGQCSFFLFKNLNVVVRLFQTWHWRMRANLDPLNHWMLWTFRHDGFLYILRTCPQLGYSCFEVAFEFIFSHNLSRYLQLPKCFGLKCFFRFISQQLITIYQMSTKVFCWYHKVGREEARLSSLFKLWQQNKTSADIVFGNWFLFTDVTKKYNFMKITLQVHVGFGPIFKSLLFLNRCFKKGKKEGKIVPAAVMSQHVLVTKAIDLT